MMGRGYEMMGTNLRIQTVFRNVGADILGSVARIICDLLRCGLGMVYREDNEMVSSST